MESKIMELDNQKIRKMLLALIAVLVLILIVFAAYNIFIKKGAPSAGEEETESPASFLQTADKAGAISQEPVLGTVIDREKVRYYLKETGYVFESDFNGSRLTQISSTNLPNLLEALWSPSKSKVISIFNIGGEVKKYAYDYITGISTPLSEYIQHIAWSPDEDKIAYQYYNPADETSNSINIANAAAGQWTKILQTRIKDIIVEWPSTDKIAIQTKPSGLAQGIVYLINLQNNDFEKVISETYGLTLLWSPFGDKILYSETNNQGTNLKLKVFDVTKQVAADLDIVTLPEKCVWSQDNRTVFCAIPSYIPGTALLPDDYYKDAVSFSDTIWRINLDTGETVQVNGAGAYDAVNLLLSPLEDYLFFINKTDGLLYSLPL